MSLNKLNLEPNTTIRNYELISKIGEGTYGKIYSVNNLNTNKVQVLKILKNDSSFLKSNLNEISILKKIYEYHEKNYKDKNEYVSIILDNFFYKAHNIIVLKKYSKNLHEEQKSNNFSGKQIRKIAFDILKGLDFLKKNKIIHGDLKPENILFYDDKTYNVIICDFSLSIDNEINPKKINHNLQSIWYRSPEVMLKLDYDYNIDMWSLGCILFELYFSKSLFSCKTNKQLFIKIYSMLGPPSKDIINSNTYTKSYFNLNYEPVMEIDSEIYNKMTKYLYNIKVNCNCSIIRNIIFGSLTWNSDSRISIEECLNLFKN